MKVRLTHEVQERWRTGDLREIGRCSPPDEPKREETLSVVAPGKIKRGKGGTLVFQIISNKSHPLKVILWLPLPRLYRNLGVTPGYTAVYSCMASDWHPRTKIY